MATRPIPGYAAPPPDVPHPEYDTFLRPLRFNAGRLPRHVAIREKDLGIWQVYTWRDYFERSRLGFTANCPDLKFSPCVKEAVCIGQGRRYVAALINIDRAAVGNWVERRGVAYTSYTDLSQKPEVSPPCWWRRSSGS